MSSDFSDVTRHLPTFIEVFWKNYKSGIGNKNWSDFTSHYWHQHGVINIKYEDLHLDAENALAKALTKLGENTTNKKITAVVKKYSFKAQTGRNKGEINKESFLRKGLVGDWKNYFNAEAAEVFNFYAGDALIRYGYERSKNWHSG